MRNYMRICCQFRIRTPSTIFAHVPINKFTTNSHRVRCGDCRDATRCEDDANLLPILYSHIQPICCEFVESQVFRTECEVDKFIVFAVFAILNSPIWQYENSVLFVYLVFCKRIFFFLVRFEPKPILLSISETKNVIAKVDRTTFCTEWKFAFTVTLA